ncbi:MAG: phosphoribosylformylglycinamidine synthase [Mycoplasmataceae bacterium]|nr:phosphoribosylformylglycinamidine synthase [Mycoplasmataceae bacterium]
MSIESNTQLVFAEKKPPFNIEALQLLHELRVNLNVKSLRHVRILIKYLVNNVDHKTFTSSLNTIFSEPQVDYLYLKKFPKNPQANVFGVAFLPGQFDQRADSAEQCLKLINPRSNPIVNTAIIYVLEGNLSDEDLKKIKKYLINKIDSHEVSVYTSELVKPQVKSTLIEIIHGFRQWNEQQLESFHQRKTLAMSIDDLLLIQRYFIQEAREPTITEIKVIDTYWSDHCRHTTFETKLKKINLPNGLYAKPIVKAYQDYLHSRVYVYGKRHHRKISLMDIATICAKELRKSGKLSSLDLSDENNACSINVNVKIDNKIVKYLLMFKNETHNHPTEIEPFGGAATCLGGAIRDPLSGRTYVYQAMRVTGSGDPTVSLNETLPNKLSQRTITLGAAKGYSSYGNQIGLATGQVDEVYHPGYVAKRMEIGAVIGAAPKNNVVRKTPQSSDVIILLGGRTGKDGIGGATGSSKAHTIKSINEASAEVQKGNPICERKIQRLFRNPAATQLIKKCNDFGAGGVSVAIGELCRGVEINLNAVPKKYLGLNGTEIAISESQERMAVIVSKQDKNEFIALAQKENLEATVVAKVTNTNRLQMYWNNKLIVNLSRDFLDTNGVEQVSDVKVTLPAILKVRKVLDVKKYWKNMLTDLNVCSKIGMIQRFDSTIGANTILMPLGGKNQLTPAEGMAALIPTFNTCIKSETASLMAYGFNPYLGEWSPFHMAYYSVIESITKIVAMGGDWTNVYLSFQEYFEKLQKNEIKWGKPFSALLGAYTVQKKLGLAAIGGKDSMSGTYENLHVPPTLVSFAITTTDAKNVISPEFKQIGSTVVLVTPKYLQDGTINLNILKKNFDVIHHAIINQQIISAYALKHYGIAEGLSKMVIGNDIGVNFNGLDSNDLFKKRYGSLIVEIPKQFDPHIVLHKANYQIIGLTTQSKFIVNKQLNFKLSINDVKNLMISKLSNLFVNTTPIDNRNILLKHFLVDKPMFSQKIVNTPLVVIPVFPGTNCEYDSQLAFERAGAKVQQVIISNFTPQVLLSSIKQLAKAIKKANIIMIPGGFSAADEPDGSAKFIVNVFNNPHVKKAVDDFLNKREGLMIGICNGFQALIKLGLLPYGKIQKPTKDAPTLTFNKIAHHMSGVVHTKVVSNKSPWFMYLKPGDVRSVPISHGEGQFVANKAWIKKWEKHGQITTQYVDLNYCPTMNMPWNPNGSFYAVEGMTSLDGRILGKMGHSERIANNLYRNVVGVYDQKIFESGVSYFTHKLIK